MTLNNNQSSCSCSCLCRYDVTLLERLDSWTAIFLIDGERVTLNMARMICVPDVGQTGVIYSHPVGIGHVHIFEKYESQCWRRRPEEDSNQHWAWSWIGTTNIAWHTPGELPVDYWFELPMWA